MVMFEMRNGFGIDLELANSRPVGLVNTETDEAFLGYFEGFVLLLPFVSILYGEVYAEGEE